MFDESKVCVPMQGNSFREASRTLPAHNIHHQQTFGLRLECLKCGTTAEAQVNVGGLGPTLHVNLLQARIGNEHEE
jgi:hypothetical protein